MPYMYICLPKSNRKSLANYAATVIVKFQQADVIFQQLHNISHSHSQNATHLVCRSI